MQLRTVLWKYADVNGRVIGYMSVRAGGPTTTQSRYRVRHKIYNAVPRSKLSRISAVYLS